MKIPKLHLLLQRGKTVNINKYVSLERYLSRVPEVLHNINYVATTYICMYSDDLSDMPTLALEHCTSTDLCTHNY